MKNFFKKIAFVLALAMVLTNIGPVANASAAAAPSLKYTSKALYVGDDVSGKYSNSCWTPSQNYAGYKVSYDWDKDFIDVTSNGKITANGKGIGAAVVTVTYSKEGTKDIVKYFTVKVRRNAETVKLTKASEALIENAISLGETVKLQAAKSIDGSYAKGHYGLDNYMGVCSDQLQLVSSNPDVIKVNGMNIEAVGVGEATLTVQATQYLQPNVKTVSKSYEVAVIGGILGAEQITSNTVKVVFGQELPVGVTTDNFEIVQAATTADFGIKGIVISSDRKSVTIETFFDMDDGGEYEVKYTNGDVAYAKSFEATDGIVASFNVNKTTIPYNYATVITVDLYDADGVKIASVKESETAKYNLEWTWDTNGAMMDDKLILYAKGDAAKLTVTYRTGEYKEGNEIVIGPKTFEIKALDIAIDSVMQATITDNMKKPCIYDWAGLTENRELKVEDENIYVHLRITDDLGNEITQDLFRDYGYYLESSNENILQVQPHVLHDHTQWDPNHAHFDNDEGIYAAIYGIKAGSANVIVKNSDGKVMMSIPVTVQAKRKFVTFDLATANVSVSNTSLLALEATVDMTVKDQYGSKTYVDYSQYINIDLQNGESGANAPVPAIKYNTGYNGLMRIHFPATGCDAGTYRYKVTMVKDDVTQVKYISVVVREADNNGSNTYKLVIGGDKDSAYTETYHNNKKATIYVEHYKGGVLYQNLEMDTDNTDGTGPNTIQSLTISYGTKAEGVIVVSQVGVTFNNGATLSSGSAVGSTATVGLAAGTGSEDGVKHPSTTSDNNKAYYYVNVVSGGSTIEKAAKGTRTVKAVILDNDDKSVTLTGSFNIVDSQPAVTATANTSTVSLNTLSNGDVENAIKKALTFKVNGKTINEDAEDSCIEIVGVKTTGVSMVTGASVVRLADGKSIAAQNNYTNILGGDELQAGDKIAIGTVLIQYKQSDSHSYVWYEVPVNRILNITK